MSNMKELHEIYIFHQECLTSLNTALSIVEALSTTNTRSIINWAAYRMALIEYAKPYKKSKGKKIKNHVLPITKLSTEDIKLHERVIVLRDQLLAHSDITIKDAELLIFPSQNETYALIVSNTDPELPSISEFHRLIENSLENWRNIEIPKQE